VFASDDADWVAGKVIPEPEPDGVAPPTPIVVDTIGVVSVKLEAKYVELIEPAVAGIAFNTELTKKLSVTTASPDVHALFKTTVVPVVAVKSVDTRRTPFLYTSM
jgi:hypothetical protein